MTNRSRREFLGALGAAPVAGGLSMISTSATGAPAAAGADRVQEQARESARLRYFPNLTLRTQDDKEVRFYDDLIKGKVVTINFFYAKCDDVCPIVTSNLVKVQQLLGDQVGRQVFMYSFSLKPAEDTPRAMKEYAEMHGVKPGWTFLTGKPEDLELLRRKLGFTTPDRTADKDVTNHTGNIRYGNEPLMLWGATPGMASPEWIAESIEWMVHPDAVRQEHKHPEARPDTPRPQHKHPAG
jgi:protein SCO1/2